MALSTDTSTSNISTQISNNHLQNKVLHKQQNELLLSKENDLFQIEQARFVYAKLPSEGLATNDALPLVLKDTLPPLQYNLNNNASSFSNGVDTLKDLNKITLNDDKKLKDSNKIQSYKGTEHISYWQTVHSIESKQGKLMYRPRNKSRNCTYTTGPCGHHQLTVQALKDIGCHSLQCRKDRLNYKKSLKLSEKLLALNEKRLSKNGVFVLQNYQRYLIHQQGATGIKNILIAREGKTELSKTILKNMANNSPYSYKKLKRMTSQVAAKQFLQYWESKWLKEKRLIAGIDQNATDSLVKADFIPTFSDNEILLALNYKF